MNRTLLGPPSRFGALARAFGARRDLVLTGALFGLGLAELLLAETYQGRPAWPGPTWAGLIQVSWLTLPLVWRRSRPLTSSITVLAGVVVTSLAWGAAESTAAFLVIVVTTFSGIAYSRRPVVVLAAAFVALAAHNLRDPSVTGVGDWFWSAGFVAVASLLGAAQRSRQLRIVSLQHDATTMAREHDQRVAAATAAERAAIARELHDVVAHAVSVIVIHAQASGRAVEDNEPDVARELLGTIEDTGRAALGDLRRMLQVLDNGGPPLDPSPGLSHLDSLVEGFRAAGLTVSLEVPDPLPPLTGAADLAAYRLVQEGLTNVLRHAAGANVWVRVSRRGETVELIVENDGGSNVPSRSDGSGRGLIGMRERVSLAGGTLLESGPTDTGFRVSARLPIHGPDTPTPSPMPLAAPTTAAT